MIEITQKWSGVIALIAIALAWFFTGHNAGFGSSANGGNVTNYDAVSVTDGYYISDVLSLSSLFSNLSGFLTNKPTAVATSTTGGSLTMTQTELQAGQYYTVSWLTAITDLAWTLPASSTLTSILTSTGNNARWCFQNGTTTAGVDITFLAGTGIDLEMATSSGNIESIGPGDSGCLTLQKKANTDLTGRLEIYDDSD